MARVHCRTFPIRGTALESDRLEIREICEQMTKKVLSIGQCAFDDSNIWEMLKNNFAVVVETAASHDEALAKIGENDFDLVLVNRIYDATGTPGLKTITALKSESKTRYVPVMLVSNFEDAQSAAVEAGAVSGFGKTALANQRTIEILKAYLSE